MNTSAGVGEIQAALVAFHLKDVNVKKDAENPHFHSSFASLAANIEAADVTAAECGLCVVQLMTTIVVDGQIFDGLATRICHASGEFIEDVQLMHLPKDDPQGQGSAMTYGRRYNYQGAYGLVAEDDDAQSASDAVASSGSTAAGGSPATSRSSRSSSRSADPDSKVGLIVTIAKAVNFSSADLKKFVQTTLGLAEPNEDLNLLDAIQQNVIVEALRAKEREMKEGS